MIDICSEKNQEKVDNLPQRELVLENFDFFEKFSLAWMNISQN